MSDYEFWKELGKIFNAVVSYQEKSIEFNKRFINPWIRIGNVFDEQDHQREEVRAYKQITEIDPDNAQNWVDLGNACYRNQSYDEAVVAFQKAIELDPNLGWSYSNLALIYAEQNKHVEAKALYEKGISLLKEDCDKAVAWNRLGNLHRKLNEYELAIRAFQKADELDRENAGFKDVLGEKFVKSDRQEGEPAQNDSIATSIQLIVKQSQSEDEVAKPFETGSGQQTKEQKQLDLASFANDEPSSSSEKSAPGYAGLPEPSGEDIGPVDGMSGSELEEVPAETLVASVVAETDTSDSVSEINGTFTNDTLPEQVVNTESVYATPTITHTEDVVASTPSEFAAEAVESAAVLERMEPVAEPSQVSNPVESAVEAAEPAISVVSDASVAEAVGFVTAAVAEEPIEEVVEVTHPIESVAEANGFASVSQTPEPATSATEDRFVGTAEVANPVEPVIEATGPIAFVVVEESAVEMIKAPTPIEVVVETTEPGATAVMEEEVSDAVESVTMVVAEEPVAEIAEVMDIPESEALSTDAGIDPIQENSDLDGTATEVMSAVESVEELAVAQHPAYEAFLEAEEQTLTSIPTQVSSDMLEREPVTAQRKAIAIVDESGEFQLEMDAKNAHVWNELGNVYFNRGAVEDAIVAYSKAIELDRLFAWPYSNLALAYVQKGRFAEAMLLYQRSIELFMDDKDKAISWNRLGNVYRRLNDYDNAISAYQRADELDHDNSTIYLQSRFSLLGNFQMEQNTNLTQ